MKTIQIFNTMILLVYKYMTIQSKQSDHNCKVLSARNESVNILLLGVHTYKHLPLKNPAYWRHQISRPMRIKAPIPLKYAVRKKIIKMGVRLGGVGSSRVGSGRVGLGWVWVGLGWVGSGWMESGHVGLGQVVSGRVGSGRGGGGGVKVADFSRR